MGSPDDRCAYVYSDDVMSGLCYAPRSDHDRRSHPFVEPVPDRQGDRCAKPGCGQPRSHHVHAWIGANDYQGRHPFVEPVPAPQEGESYLQAACDVEIALAAIVHDHLGDSDLPESDMWLAVREAYRAGLEAGRASAANVLDHDNDALVGEIAFEIGQSTKMAPSMDGRCHRLHGDEENRRIARAVLRYLRRAQSNPTGGNDHGSVG